MFNKIPKQINVVHLVYLSILFSVVLGFVIVIEFGPSPYAGEMLNFGATLSSIILAIVAILITLLDVAGQKSSVLEIKESSKKMEEIIYKSDEILSKTQEQFQEITILSNQLVSKVEDTIELYNDLRKVVSETQEDKIDKNSINSIIEEYEKKKNKTQIVEVRPHKRYGGNTLEVKRFIHINYEIGRQFTFDDLKMDIEREYNRPYPNSILLFALEHLINRGLIKEDIIKDVTFYEILKKGNN